MEFETDLQCSKWAVFKHSTQIVTATCFETYEWRMQHPTGKQKNLKCGVCCMEVFPLISMSFGSEPQGDAEGL